MNKQEIKKATECCERYKGVVETYGSKKSAKEDKRLIDLAISALEQQLTNGWIPVSERLPEENGTYIVTQAAHSLRDYDKVLRLDTVCVDFSNGTWRRAKHLEVIAWQPLPPKYKEVSE